jgi:RNA polymerase sigma-70 factor (ECF subfamily)
VPGPPESGESAFAAFYQRHARAVWAYVYRSTGSGADADDIVQEAFCRLAMADVELVSEESRRRYVFTIAGNLMTDRWRRASRERAWIEQETHESSRVQAPPAHHDVEETFNLLKPRERQLLWLAYVEQHDHQAIAEALSVERGSVKVMLSRARERLRALLTSRGIGGL